MIDGKKPAETAVDCLRSRYTAYAIGEVDYIVDTHHSSTREEISRESVEEWSRGSEWLELAVLEAENGGKDDEEGTVRFRARYRQKGGVFEHMENAFFKKEEGQWRFVDAWTPPFKSEEKKTGRNDPCPCGSGKKFKKCCLGKS
jgi:SEC-C motif-containing protein